MFSPKADFPFFVAGRVLLPSPFPASIFDLTLEAGFLTGTSASVEGMGVMTTLPLTFLMSTWGPDLRLLRLESSGSC